MLLREQCTVDFTNHLALSSDDLKGQGSSLTYGWNVDSEILVIESCCNCVNIWNYNFIKFELNLGKD